VAKVRFVSQNFKIQEGTVTLFNLSPEIPQDLAKVAEAFSAFPLQPDMAEIAVGGPGRIQGSLSSIVLRRTPDGTLNRVNFCSFNENITDSALRLGELHVDLSSYKEVILRLRWIEPMVSRFTVFNVTILETPIPTFDLTINDFGESSLLLKLGHYRVIAAGKSQRVVKHFEIANDDVEPRIIEF